MGTAKILHASGIQDACMVEKSALVKSLAKLWDSQELCDCTLITADQQHFQCHRLVLAAVSDYFNAVMVGSGQLMLNSVSKHEDGKWTIELSEISGHSLQLLLQAVYQQDFQLTEERVEHLLPAAAYLQVEMVLLACTQFLKQNCCSASCIWTMVLAERYGLQDVFQEALAAAASSPVHMSSRNQQQHFVMLTRESLLALLGTTWLHDIASYKAILLWADADPADRSEHIPGMCDEVFKSSYVQCPFKELSQLQCADEVRQALLKWVKRQQHTIGARADDSTCTRDPLTMHHSSGSSQLLIAGGHDVTWQSFRSVELYNAQKDSWSRGVPMPHRESFAGCAVVQQQVALLGGGWHGRSMTVFDPGTHSWRAAKAPHICRLHSAVASMQGSLFVLGGRVANGTASELQSVEVCTSLPTGPVNELEGPAPVNWFSTADMTVPRTCLAAAAVGSSLYAIGGQAGRQTWRTVEAYDAQQDRWLQLSGSMHSERKYTSAAALHGRLYVAGGMTSTRSRLASVEAFDPREGSWSLVADMGVARSSAGVAALADCLCAVGGNAGDDWIHSSVEMYIPAAGKWLQRAPVAFARSGLAIAAL